MKTASDNFISNEEAATNQPYELYQVWQGSNVWYYTNGDTPIVYGAYTYEPATIERGTVEYNSNLEVSQLELRVGRVLDPVLEYIARSPIDDFGVAVARFFRESPTDISIIFRGQVSSIKIVGVAAIVTCVGFEAYLKRNIPRYRVLGQCNWTLFDARCGLSAGSYAISTTVDSVDATARQIKAEDLAKKTSGYFKWGYVLHDNRRYMVVGHNGAYLTLRSPLVNIMPTDSIMVYPGCDGEKATCVNKYNNAINFGGHTEVPDDNPVLWIR